MTISPLLYVYNIIGVPINQYNYPKTKALSLEVVAIGFSEALFCTGNQNYIC